MKVRRCFIKALSFICLCLLCTLSAQAGSFADNLWNVKFFSCDVSHNNDFILQRDATPVCGSGNCPGSPGSCWGTTYTQNRFINGGYYDWSVGSLGAIHIHHDRDYQFYADTWLYVSAPKILQVPFVADVGRMWINDADVTPNAVNGVIPLPLSSGWNHLEITTYNQNQGAQNEINFAFANQVERIASNTNSPATNTLPVINANYGLLFCGDVVQGTISSIGQSNLYSFSGNAGEVIRLTVTATSGDMVAHGSAYAEVFGPSGNFLASFGYKGNVWQLTLPATGTYTVSLRDCYNFYTGIYNFSLAFATPRCGIPITCGQVVSNSLWNVAQVDTYNFTGNAGEVVRITATATSGAMKTNASAYAEIFGPTGNSLGSFGYKGNITQLTLPTTGTYTVFLRDYINFYTGNYNMSLAFATPRCGTTINCGQVVTDRLENVTQVDTYNFTGNAGEVVRITATATSGGMQTNASGYAEVFSPTGSLLGSLGFGVNGNVKQLALPVNGTYTLFLRDYYNFYTGSYTIGLTFNGGCVQIPSVHLVNQVLHLMVFGEAGRTYRVDTSTNLTSWDLGQAMTFTNPYLDFAISNLTQHPRVFYRAVLLP